MLLQVLWELLCQGGARSANSLSGHMSREGGLHNICINVKEAVRKDSRQACSFLFSFYYFFKNYITVLIKYKAFRRKHCLSLTLTDQRILIFLNLPEGRCAQKGDEWRQGWTPAPELHWSPQCWRTGSGELRVKCKGDQPQGCVWPFPWRASLSQRASETTTLKFASKLYFLKTTEETLSGLSFLFSLILQSP